VLGAYAVVLGATQYGPTIWSWSTIGLTHSKFVEYIRTSDVELGVIVGVLVLLAGVALQSRSVSASRQVHVSAVVGALVLIGFGYPLQQSYLRHRYETTPPLVDVYRWAQSQHDQRIAVIGIDLQYPLYGRDDSNYVQYIGRRGKHGSFTPYTTCEAWRRAIDAGHYDYVLVAPRGFGLIAKAAVPPELTWTQQDPHSEIVVRDGPPGASAVLLRLSGPLDPNTCGAG
jgi:hypothetical protein